MPPSGLKMPENAGTERESPKSAGKMGENQGGVRATFQPRDGRSAIDGERKNRTGIFDSRRRSLPGGLNARAGRGGGA
jgi:hypothetical protein